MGNPPAVEGSLAAMAAALSRRSTVEQVSQALDRCATEKYPVRLPHILNNLPGSEEADVNGLKRLAWETVEIYTSKWARWNSERTTGTLDSKAPPLDQRIVDSVRRSGGWTVYMRMTDKDFPFQQARFFEEYEAWSEIQRISTVPHGYLGTSSTVPCLPPAKTESKAGIPADYEPPKVIPPPRPPIDYEKRRKELEDQAEKLKSRAPKPLPWVEKEFEGPGGDDLENPID